MVRALSFTIDYGNGSKAIFAIPEFLVIWILLAVVVLMIFNWRYKLKNRELNLKEWEKAENDYRTQDSFRQPSTGYAGDRSERTGGVNDPHSSDRHLYRDLQ